MEKPRMIDFEYYLVLNAEKRGCYFYRGTMPRISVSKPNLKGNEIAVKINLKVDDRHFSKPTLEVAGDVPYMGKEKEALLNRATEAAAMVGEMLDMKINVLE